MRCLPRRIIEMDGPQDALIKALKNPKTFPEGAGEILFKETHISYLSFSDDRVYKFKKHVDFGFLNFSTLDRRRFYCQEEVRLNSRFAPQTYLKVVELRRQGNKFHIDGQGKLIDYATVMHRLPSDRMLDQMIQNENKELPNAINALAPVLAKHHQASDICQLDGGRTNLERIRINWRENFDQSAGLTGISLFPEALDLTRRYVESFLEANSELLLQREQKGWVRDGHGDLHTEHICLCDPIQIYDCIEFNRRFRVADVAADIAFLLMDLDFKQRRDLTEIFLSGYRQSMGTDACPKPLLQFYKVYRAWVRAKVESFLHLDKTASAETRTEALATAQKHFSQALGYLCPPFMVMFCGLMGSGKSTLAKSLAERTDATLIRSDEVRKKLAGPGCEATGSLDFKADIYSDLFSEKTYDWMLGFATKELSAGKSVIVDASFNNREFRKRFIHQANNMGFTPMLIQTVCPRQTALERLDLRQAKGTDPSDGRRDLYDQQASTFDPLPSDKNVLNIDTTQPLDYITQRVLCRLAEKH